MSVPTEGRYNGRERGVGHTECPFPTQVVLMINYCLKSQLNGGGGGGGITMTSLTWLTWVRGSGVIRPEAGGGAG